MPKKRPVSLAPVSAGKPPRIYRTAAAALSDFEKIGYRQPEAPTPERLVRAAGSAKVQRFAEVVEIARGDKFEPTPVDMVRVRVEDSPLGKMRDRGILCRGEGREDRAMNLILFHAGERYHELWYRAGLQRLGSIDFEKISSPGFSPRGFFGSESQICAFDDFGKARAAIFEDFREAVDLIVLREQDPVEVGRAVGSYAAPKQAVAVALFVLRRGLKQLARHFGLISASDGGAQ